MPTFPVRSASVPLLALLLASPALAAAVPPALQGQWEYGSVSPIEYYDTSTGKYAESSGTSEIIRIYADGRYDRSGIIVVTTYGCTSKLLTSSKGTVRLQGNLLTLTPTTAYNKGYTCSPSKMYENHKLIASVFTWKLNGNTLVLGDPQGEARDSLYNRPRTLGASPAGQQVRRIVGVLSAPAGQVLRGAAVIACRVDRGCDAQDGSVRFMVLPNGNARQPFTLDNLDATPYEVFAWQDVNGNGTPDPGDWADTASVHDAPGVTVTPPVTDVFLTLEQWR